MTSGQTFKAPMSDHQTATTSATSSQPGESAQKFWNWFLTKKNQIVNYPNAEAIAAFRHSIRDKWLARQFGQDKPRIMAALTSLMTRFCAGVGSWLARSLHTVRPVPQRHATTTANPGAVKISAGARMAAATPRTPQSMQGSAALGPDRKRTFQGK